MDEVKQYSTWDEVIKSMVAPEEVTIKIKYFDDIYLSVPKKLEKINKGDWIDLYTMDDVDIYKGQSCLIPLGVAMKLPKGFEAIIVPRSSTFNKYGVIQTNSIGVIDESYCGNDDMWRLPVYALRDTHIPIHTRICQFRLFRHQPTIVFEEVDRLEDANRGGFGSTGV